MTTSRYAGRRGGWEPLIFSSRGTRLTRHSTDSSPAAGPKGRPDYLGVTDLGRGIERRGSAFVAWLSDCIARREYLPGLFATAEAAMAAARTAFAQQEAAANV
jgi:hypothetical protein